MPSETIIINISELEFQEQKTAVRESFEAVGWVLEKCKSVSNKQNSKKPELLRFRWEKADAPVYPALPARCAYVQLR